MSDFRVNIDNFIGENIWRLIKSGMKRKDEITLMLLQLRNERLTSELIEEDISKELCDLLSLEYEENIHSDRLNGHGVSVKNIQLTIKSSMEAKLQKITQILK